MSLDFAIFGLAFSLKRAFSMQNGLWDWNVDFDATRGPHLSFSPLSVFKIFVQKVILWNLKKLFFYCDGEIKHVWPNLNRENGMKP